MPMSEERGPGSRGGIHVSVAQIVSGVKGWVFGGGWGCRRWALNLENKRVAHYRSLTGTVQVRRSRYRYSHRMFQQTPPEKEPKRHAPWPCCVKMYVVGASRATSRFVVKRGGDAEELCAVPKKVVVGRACVAGSGNEALSVYDTRCRWGEVAELRGLSENRMVVPSSESKFSRTGNFRAPCPLEKNKTHSTPAFQMPSVAHSATKRQTIG